MAASPRQPAVTIGLVVYNGEHCVGRALDALLAQTYSDFEIVISDNGSTDATGDICAAYAARDGRVRYVRHPVNRGLAANLQFVWDEARGEYFMWAAADDVKAPEYLAANVAALKSNPGLVASTSPNCYEGEETLPAALVTFALTGSLYERLQGFLANCWRSHGVFFSLMRRSALEGWRFPPLYFIAADWCVNVHLLFEGGVGRTSEGLLVTGRKGMSNQKNHYRTYTAKPIERVLPLYEFSRRTGALILASKQLSTREKALLLARLIELNAINRYGAARRWLKVKLQGSSSRAPLGAGAQHS